MVMVTLCLVKLKLQRQSARKNEEDRRFQANQPIEDAADTASVLLPKQRRVFSENL